MKYLITLFLIFTFALTQPLTPCTQNVKITDDAQLNTIISNARSKFLATRPHPFTRLDTTLLIPQSDGSWKRGSYNPNEGSYPASCIKLTYLVSAINWCMTNGFPYDCLDEHVRPMIQVSDNQETGIVVDYITGAPNVNINEKNQAFFDWLKKRNYTQEWFSQRGMLENQILIHKTYPSNSGSDPMGAEALARDYLGMNKMTPKCAASLMLEIVTGNIVPEAKTYMMQLLHHQRTSLSTYGSGLPPGTILYTKTGNAYDTLEEIAYINLPNGNNFILATLTNGFEPTESFDTLSYYAELVTDLTGLSSGITKIIFDTGSSQFYTEGSDWKKGIHAHDMYGPNYYYNTNPKGQTAGWSFVLNQTALYEVSIWYPEFTDHPIDVPFTLSHVEGTTKFTINQQKHGGRWVKLGDVTFQANQKYNLHVEAKTKYADKIIAINAMKITLWPSCNFRGIIIPGTSCHSIKG